MAWESRITFLPAMEVCVRVSVCVPVCICILAPVCVLFTRLEGLAQWKSFLGALFSN